LNEFVAETGANRGHVLSHFSATFSRFTMLSRSHEALARIPFETAVTTNYDLLLENLGAPWGANVVTIRSGRPPENIGTSFLLKLYGELALTQSVLLSRAEFETAIVNSIAQQIVRWLLQSRTMFFVGCSLEGLLIDLAAIGPPPKLAGKHFAVAAVSSTVWKAQALELAKLYGIEVLPCSAEGISAALPVFLESLAGQCVDAPAAASERVAS
jgi:hypothetical protein